MENNKSPQCIGCKQIEHMEIETRTACMEHWHCSYCGTKTQKATLFGKARPFIGIFTLLFFGFKS